MEIFANLPHTIVPAMDWLYVSPYHSYVVTLIPNMMVFEMGIWEVIRTWE